MRSPSIFGWWDPWFVQIVLNFFLWSSSIGFTAVKNTDCFSLLKLLLLESIHFWLLNIFHSHFRCGRCTRRSHPATVHCGATQDQRDYLLNDPEMLWNTGNVWKSWGSSNFFGPPPFARKVIQASTVHCEVPSNFALNSSIRSSSRTAPSSSRGIDEPCRSIPIMAFDTAK